MVSVIVVHSLKWILISREVLLRAGFSEHPGSRVYQAVIFHSLLAHFQAVPENENRNLGWNHNLHHLLRPYLCARFVFFDTASGRDLCYTCPKPSFQRWITTWCSNGCCRAGVRPHHYHDTCLWRLPASALKSAETQYQLGFLDWRLVSSC